MMYVKYYEKEIPDKGMGVFASEFIPKGTLIWKLTETKKFTKEEWEKLPHEIRKDAYPDSDGNFVAAVGKGESWNHSCDTNTWWTADDELSARRDIQKDEELTYDYATSDIDETKGTDVAYDWECKCGSKNCRKILHWNDILEPEIYNTYKGHLPSWVEKFVKEHNKNI
ncbi:MAG: SET domain-containing protein-lysine N-methyltransferase [bacterium]|nr:MAG: SET domain-containing protein-lysine N-methyltransferase [bacterium]